MKKFSILLAILAIILAGCSKDEAAESSVAFVEGQKVTLTASVIDNATRATSEYNDGTSQIDFKWSAGDVLTVTAGGKSATFTMKAVAGEGAGYSTATFEGTMPASGDKFDASFGSSTIPTTQTYSATEPIPSNALYFTATNCTLNGSLTLQPQIPLLNLNLYGPTTTTISKIVVKKGGTAYTLDCSNGGAGITLPTTEAAAQKFFMVIPTGSETFTVGVYDNASTPSEICSFSKTSTAAVAAGSYLIMPAKEVKAPAGICFTAEEANSTVAMTGAPNLMTSTDGSSFTDWDGSAVTLTDIGDKLYVKANSTGNKVIQKSFSGSGKLKVSGNVMTLLNADSPATAMTSENEDCFPSLFKNMPVTDISELKLPATTLAAGCYSSMFNGCTSLVAIPTTLLPAKDLVGYCYPSMFKGCKSLTDIPEDLLPATTLKENCYYSMFADCTSLTAIPAKLLQATTLARNCYSSMFAGCTSLTAIPESLLPVTTMATKCYSNMFNGCTKLTTIPENLLPATALSTNCYSDMFNSCTSLTTIPENLLPATTAKDYSVW